MVSNLMLNDKSNNNKLNTLENKINKISTYINNNNINKTETINKLNKISTYINSINNNSNYINRLTYLGKFLNIPN
jgi:ribosomal protein S15P/S13E